MLHSFGRIGTAIKMNKVQLSSTPWTNHVHTTHTHSHTQINNGLFYFHKILKQTKLISGIGSHVSSYFWGIRGSI